MRAKAEDAQEVYAVLFENSACCCVAETMWRFFAFYNGLNL